MATKYLYIVTNTDGAIIFRGEREAAYNVAAQGSLLTVRPIEADKAFFEVSAQHMEYSMRGHGPQIFPVVLVEKNRVGGPGFNEFVVLDTSAFPGMHGKQMTVAAARGRFVSSATPDGACIASYWTDGKPSNGIGKNKGRRTAIGYFVDKCAVVSFPPRLNGGRIPELDDVPAILAGQTVAAAMTAFNQETVRGLAEKMNVEKLDWLQYPACDELILLADAGGIFIVDAITHERIKRVADSWIDAQSEELPAPPAVIYLDVDMFNALPAPLESCDDENARAIDAEEARAARARRLAGPHE